MFARDRGDARLHELDKAQLWLVDGGQEILARRGVFAPHRMVRARKSEAAPVAHRIAKSCWETIMFPAKVRR